MGEIVKGKIRQLPDVLSKRGYRFVDSFARGGSNMETFLSISPEGKRVIVKHSDWQGVTGDGTPWLLGQANRLKSILVSNIFPDEAKKLYPRVLDFVRISEDEGFYVMEYFEDSQDLAQYYWDQPNLTSHEMLNDLSQILTMMVETHYQHGVERYDREIHHNWVNRPKNRIALLQERNNEIYERLVRGNRFHLDSLKFEDASYFFEDLISRQYIVIQGVTYPNLPVLIRILEEYADSVAQHLGPTHYSPLIHGDLSIRNFLRVSSKSSKPLDKFRLMDVRVQVKIHEVTPFKTSIEYDLAKLAYSPFMEIVRSGFYEICYDIGKAQQKGTFAFTMQCITSPGVIRYRECRNSFYKMLRENEALEKLMEGIPNKWEDYVRLGECMNYASDAVHRYSQDSSGIHSLAYYLEATVGLHRWLLNNDPYALELSCGRIEKREVYARNFEGGVRL